TLILAGTDTTSGTLTWTLSLLLNNREVLNKAIQELDTHIAAPLNIPHESIEDCTVGGYHVPSGTRLLTNVSKLQRDPILYIDPLEFRPERFLTTHKDVDVKGQHFELIPFGSGRRMCPGISFGIQLMQITLATLLHRFDIITPNEGPVDMAEQNGLTTIKASPLEVILTPRLSTQGFSQNT
ncbi:cytochrome p450, partial [Trifolium pratense]